MPTTKMPLMRRAEGPTRLLLLAAFTAILVFAMVPATLAAAPAQAGASPDSVSTTASAPPLALPGRDSANASYTPCADHKTCDDCLAASYTCHFCEFDFQCHAIGSMSGCVVGMSTCHHIEDCKRPEPQHVGYGPPPSVVIAVLCIMVTLTCCICGVASICSVFLNRKNRRSLSTAAAAAAKRKQNAKNSARRAGTDESLAESQQEPLLADAHEREISLFEEDVDNAALERVRVRREREFSWRSFFLRTACVSSLIGVTVLALMFYPRMPDYNVCNRQFDWESILHSMMSLHPKIEYQVLISAINENRFGFQVEEGVADIHHNGTRVGYWKLEAPIEAKAGAITDVIAPIKIEPGYSEAYSLWTDFSNGQLVFNINATITGSITYGKHKIYRISTSVDDIEFLVGAEYDRGLCKCTEYLTPQ